MRSGNLDDDYKNLAECVEKELEAIKTKLKGVDTKLHMKAEILPKSFRPFIIFCFIMVVAYTTN